MVFLNTLNAIPAAPSTNLDTQTKELSDTIMVEPYGLGLNHFLTNHPYEDDHIIEDEVFPERKQLKKKWAKFYQGAQSPYTIAFPALIRTRRSIEDEQ